MAYQPDLVRKETPDLRFPPLPPLINPSPSPSPKKTTKKMVFFAGRASIPPVMARNKVCMLALEIDGEKPKAWILILGFLSPRSA